MKRLQADATLLFVSLIWGVAFAAQRSAAPVVGIWWFNGARFLLAGLVLLPLLIKGRFHLEGKSVALLLSAGVILAAASGFQQAGLQYTTAANAGFITTLYVVIVPVLEFFLFSRRIRFYSFLAATLAMIGAMFLSLGGKEIRLALGDLLEFAGAVLWAVHLLLVDRAVQKIDVRIFAPTQYLIAGVVQSGLGILFEPHALPLLGEVWWAVVYTGVVSVAVGYTLQASAQRYAPPVDTAILLSMESVFAAAAGYWFLAEVLYPIQILGGAMILGAVLVSQTPFFFAGKESLLRSR